MQTDMSIGTQLVWLFTLAIPIACVAWTVTHEEIFKEVTDYCRDRSENARHGYQRKFYYLFTCEYCFSHYVSMGALFLTRYHLLLDDWRGYLLAWFALVWIANQYMSIYARLKVGIKSERVEVEVLEKQLEKKLEKQLEKE